MLGTSGAVFAGIVALGINEGAYMREIIRAGIDAIDAHPWAGAQLSREPWQSTMLQIFEGLGEQIQALGVPRRAQFDAASALVNYVLGLAGQYAAGARLLARDTDRPAFLASVARSRSTNLAARLADVYARVAPHSFASAFADFATWVAETEGAQITPLALHGRATGRVAPLAVHYLRLPRNTRSVTLRFARAAVGAELTVERESEYAGRAAVSRRVRGRSVSGAVVFTIPPQLRHDASMLVVANGHASAAAAYSLSLR